MRTIAFYLPQYAPNQYNDLWWGKGFTEWSYVAQAKPLYNGHYQPHIPADLGFYDLRLKDTIVEQQKLAKQFGIYGFCYYHYWFNGELMLHKPLIYLHEHEELDYPYCICWANETWNRNWEGIHGKSNVLLDYKKEEYNAYEHLEWLFKFFSDRRYIKINGKPVVFIWRPENFENTSEVITSWRNYVNEKLSMDLYIIAADHIGTRESNSHLINLGYDAIYEFKPNWGEIDCFKTYECPIPTVTTYSYKKIVEHDIKKTYKEKVFPCVFTSWDNTSRKTTNSTIIQNNNVELYEKWLYESCKKVEKYDVEEQIVMINAWNEWGEGCHLEPDIENGRKFLEGTRKVLSNYNNIEEIIEEYKKIDKKEYEIGNNNYKEYNFSVDKDRNIFIWGTGTLGRALGDYLKSQGVNIEGYIDNDSDKWNKILKGKKIYSPNFLEDIKNKPYIIISSMFYKDISAQLKILGYKRIKDFIYADKNYLIIDKKKEYLFIIRHFSEIIKEENDIEFIQNKILTLGQDPGNGIILKADDIEKVAEKHKLNDIFYDWIIIDIGESQLEDRQFNLSGIIKILGKLILIQKHSENVKNNLKNEKYKFEYEIIKSENKKRFLVYTRM